MRWTRRQFSRFFVRRTTRPTCPSVPPGAGVGLRLQPEPALGVLNARAHTAVGKPAVQLVVFDKHFSREVADEDRSLFLAIVERVSRGAVVTSWDADLVYSVAIDVPVHPSLLRAVGLNRRKFEACSDPASHRKAFIVPSGWHR